MHIAISVSQRCQRRKASCPMDNEGRVESRTTEIEMPAAHSSIQSRRLRKDTLLFRIPHSARNPRYICRHIQGRTERLCNKSSPSPSVNPARTPFLPRGWERWQNTLGLGRLGLAFRLRLATGRVKGTDGPTTMQFSNVECGLRSVELPFVCSQHREKVGARLRLAVCRRLPSVELAFGRLRSGSSPSAREVGEAGARLRLATRIEARFEDG
jgi:hypothetical protein